MTEIRNGVLATQLSGLAWRRSRRSGAVGNCVEVAALDGDCGSQLIAIRDSRHPEGPALIYPREKVVAFVSGAKDGEFDGLITRV